MTVKACKVKACHSVPCSSARFCSVLQPSSIRVLATPWTYFLHLSLSSVSLIDSSTESPVHVLMLSVRPCVAFLAYTCTWHCSLHYLSPGNSLASSWCDHSMLASLLWRCLTVPSLGLLQLCCESTHLFSLLSTKPAESFSVLSYQRRQDSFLHSFWESSFHSRMLLQATLALSLVVSSLKSVCCDFSIFSAPIACPLFRPNLVRNSVVHSPSSVIGPKVGLRERNQLHDN